MCEEQKITLKGLFFLWKLIRGDFPVDSITMSLHISLVSKFSCCSNNKVDDSNLLFSNSALANSVESACSILSCIEQKFSLIASIDWMISSARKNNTFGQLCGILPWKIC